MKHYLLWYWRLWSLNHSCMPWYA